MEHIIDHPWSQKAIDQWYQALEWLQELPWPLFDETLSRFIFYYPLLMAYVWMLGGLIYYVRWERNRGNVLTDLPVLSHYPAVSILVPCYNEGENVRETIEYLLNQRYPNYEIIAINDGSKDDTLAILHELVGQHPRLRVVDLASNQGKAVGLRTAALMANSEILIGIDGDALLAPNATAWMVRHFIEDPHVGAVTGNPRIRNRSTLLGKIQVGEFSAIVGMIKRAQRTYGHVFTVSGVIAGFRKAALHDVGYWSPDMVTEDIDISWKLQLAGWTIRFEPNALCWVLMPETLSGLWKQRTRWAQGGVEVLLRYFKAMWTVSARGMWPLYLECCISLIWAFLVMGLLLTAPLQWLVADTPKDALDDLSPHWTSMLLCVTCLLQFAVSLLIDSAYERRNGGARHYYWMIWYPIVYWMISIGTTVNGCFKALFKKRGQRAIWVTLDRGIRQK
ncbi:MAG: poly-beta-1,6 N-acetyl-D-glucosamine synthase [Methylomonas sp.]|nr:poly-beta-1,6 N-acetyl-D-glucosamine synthase [Methylomonas sp.]PPD19392.1 MAG: poly-beta-1,6 N-acetyl-D-glucosamine synthase [Methylomonas sp.]PPD24331.1 MAG: poly-beta-1,6 N-acetyl-D-glucosamine synthase [Methylomonas sp.]PPD32883.1 MAG: poly-beta-1,6 N-acetyl-D-glucosamine synthase [Methylomonas sp.]PPD54041.1 MAG: poly-beta-1,6 N-acetyl-D-glucosamine synthase [Methylomonas sp.]